MDSKPVQFINAKLPIEVTLSEIIIDFNPSHAENACWLISVTLLPIVTEVKFVQLLNLVFNPPFCNGALLSIITEVKPMHSENAAPISVTLFGIVISVKPVQPANALEPMDVTLFGIVISVKPVQLWNALSPMDVTPLPNVISVKPVQPANAP